MPLVPLNVLLRSRRSTLTDFLDFKTQFKDYIAGWAGLDSPTQQHLNMTRWNVGGTLSLIHLMLWMDQVCKINLGFDARLAFAGYDPFDLLSESNWLVLIDPTDAGAGTLTDDGINNTINVPGTGTIQLWTGGGATDYTWRRWVATVSERGSEFRRIITLSADTTYLVHRGGDHTHAYEKDFRRNYSLAANPNVHYMSYPGELATLYHCNSTNSPATLGRYNNLVCITNTRPNFKRWRVKQFGFAGAIGARIFATGGIWADGKDTSPVVNAATGSGMQFCEYRDFRGISVSMPGSGSKLEFIDAQHDNRVPAITVDYQLYGYQCSATDCYARDSVFELAKEAFPYLPSSDPDSQGHGDNFRVNEGHRFAIQRCNFKGGAPHNQISFYNAYDTVVEYSQAENPFHLICGYNFLAGFGATPPTPDWTIRYNRFGRFGLHSTNSAAGLQKSGGSRGEQYGNVFFNDLTTLGNPEWGDSLSPHPTNDAPAVDNEAHHDFHYRSGVFRGHAAGFWAHPNATFTGNTTSFCCFVGRSASTVSATYDANVAFNAASMIANDGYGNTCTDSIFVLDNAAVNLRIQGAAGTYTSHAATETLGTWFARNSTATMADLRLTDPDAYDFTPLSGSVLITLFGIHFENMLWQPFQPDQLVLNPTLADVAPITYQDTPVTIGTNRTGEVIIGANRVGEVLIGE